MSNEGDVYLIMAPAPRSTTRPTHRRRENIRKLLIFRKLTYPSRPSKHLIHYGWAKTPLRNKIPHRRRRQIPNCRSDLPGYPGNMCKEGNTSPEPSEFQKVDIDEIVFTCKVRVLRVV